MTSVRWAWLLLISCAPWLAFIDTTYAQTVDEPSYKTAPLQRPIGDVVFSSVLDLPQTGQTYQPQVRGGQEAVPTDWPASFLLKFHTSNGDEGCTATLIGPQVLLTAAHCIPSGGRVSFSFNKNAYETICTENPNFKSDPSADFALCRVLSVFVPPDGFKYETVQDASMDSVVGGKYIVLAGFGCTSDLVAESEKLDDKYRVGFAAVNESSNSTAKSFGAEYYSGSQNNNLFTVYDSTSVSANLCPRDSGGAAFILTGGYGILTQFRSIIAINSRVFLNQTGTKYRQSLLSATGGPDFRVWATDWLKKPPSNDPSINIAPLVACGFLPTPKGNVCR